MNTLPFRHFVRNAAAVFSGRRGAVARQARESQCSRQTVYQHARQIEQRLDPAVSQAQKAQLQAENQQLAQQLADAQQRAGQAVVCDLAKLQQVATVAFAAGVSLRQIEQILAAFLPAGKAPDHSTIGRWVAQQAQKAQAILPALDAACVPHVATLAVDEIFFGGARLWSASSRPA